MMISKRFKVKRGLSVLWLAVAACLLMLSRLSPSLSATLDESLEISGGSMVPAAEIAPLVDSNPVGDDS